MHKYLLTILGIFIISTVSGCSLLPQSGPQPQYLITPYSVFQTPAGTNNEMTVIPTSPAQNTSNTAQLNIKFKSIDDAMNQLVALECPYTDNNNEKVIAQIKDRKILITSDDIDSKNKDAFMLFRYDQAWIWSATAGKGIIINLGDLPAGKGLKIGEKEIRYAGDMITNLEKYKNRCKAVNLPDNRFDPPTNINFSNSSI